METSGILANLKRYVDLSEQESQAFTGLLESKSLTKKQYLLEPGMICRHQSYVVSGCLRSFFIAAVALLGAAQELEKMASLISGRVTNQSIVESLHRPAHQSTAVTNAPLRGSYIIIFRLRPASGFAIATLFSLMLARGLAILGGENVFRLR